MNKTIFITGASSGLGKATAKLFQSKGWNVIATMRNIENETELSQLENVTLLPLDVTDLENIKSTAQKAIELGVDVVFNTAGYGLIGPLEGLSDEQITKQFNTNLLGVLRVTKEFIPYFREKKAGMFVTTTSIGGLIAFPMGSTYHATKWALEGWSESLAFELNAFGIDVKTVSPGGIKTDFMSRSIDTGSNSAYDELFGIMFQNSINMLENSSEPIQIAEVVYEAVTDGKKQLRYVAGADARALYAQRLEQGDEKFRTWMGQEFLGR